jgi:tetratricopeptide (TPR) repeat protein
MLSRYQEAIALFDKVLKIEPKDTDALNHKGCALDNFNKHQEALDVFGEVLEIDPNNLYALNNKGQQLFLLGKYQEAIGAFAEVLKNDPKDINALNNMGRSLDNLGKYQEAIALFDKVLKVDPKDINALTSKAIILLIFGKYQEALETSNEVLKIDPKNTQALGMVSLNEEQLVFAGAELAKGKKIEPVIQIEPGRTYLFFDTETTGLPLNPDAPASDRGNWPRIVQIAWALYKNGTKVSSSDFIIKPEGFVVPADAANIHGITTERAERDGVPLQVVLSEFQNAVERADFLVAHNMSFDEKIVGAELLRKNMPDALSTKKKICTKEGSTNFCAIPSITGHSGYKWPTLSELYYKLFGIRLDNTHDAVADVNATVKCFWELKKRGVL